MIEVEGNDCIMMKKPTKFIKLGSEHIAVKELSIDNGSFAFLLITTLTPTKNVGGVRMGHEPHGQNNFIFGL